jgi:hypothetical protein
MVLLTPAGESVECSLHVSLQYIRKYAFLLKKNVSCKICQLHKLNSICNVKFQVLVSEKRTGIFSHCSLNHMIQVRWTHTHTRAHTHTHTHTHTHKPARVPSSTPNLAATQYYLYNKTNSNRTLWLQTDPPPPITMHNT